MFGIVVTLANAQTSDDDQQKSVEQKSIKQQLFDFNIDDIVDSILDSITSGNGNGDWSFMPNAKKQITSGSRWKRSMDRGRRTPPSRNKRRIGALSNLMKIYKQNRYKAGETFKFSRRGGNRQAKSHMWMSTGK